MMSASGSIDTRKPNNKDEPISDKENACLSNTLLHL